jgi:23S rRNA pseudouridine1911/1915/1917 synthase
MNIEIIEKNQDYLIINKPSGLIVHGGPGIKESTLADWLVENFPEIESVGEDPQRPGIVHRLDKNVNGLMIIPRNNEAFAYFKKQFQDRKIEKEYIGLAFGAMQQDEGVIDFPIKRSSKGHKMAAIPKKRDLDPDKKISNRERGNVDALKKSRDAITSYKIIKKLINFTLLKIKIKTGRTHQIRVHLSAIGHPLAGDHLYGNKRSKIKSSKLEINRIFLMACRLKFTDNNKEIKEFSLELSPDLEEILKKAK